MTLLLGLGACAMTPQGAIKLAGDLCGPHAATEDFTVTATARARSDRTSSDFHGRADAGCESAKASHEVGVHTEVMRGPFGNEQAASGRETSTLDFSWGDGTQSGVYTHRFDDGPLYTSPYVPRYNYRYRHHR
jgi:hypothetical protein